MSDTLRQLLGLGALGAGGLLTGKTHQDVYHAVNENLKQIKVIKPDLINGIVTSFKKSLRG